MIAIDEAAESAKRKERPRTAAELRDEQNRMLDLIYKRPCRHCDSPRGLDSLYDGDYGPLCNTCYEAQV
jgi:hypothetical protein